MTFKGGVRNIVFLNKCVSTKIWFRWKFENSLILWTLIWNKLRNRLIAQNWHENRYKGEQRDMSGLATNITRMNQNHRVTCRKNARKLRKGNSVKNLFFRVLPENNPLIYQSITPTNVIVSIRRWHQMKAHSFQKN